MSGTWLIGIMADMLRFEFWLIGMILRGWGGFDFRMTDRQTFVLVVAFSKVISRS